MSCSSIVGHPGEILPNSSILMRVLGDLTFSSQLPFSFFSLYMTSVNLWFSKASSCSLCSWCLLEEREPFWFCIFMIFTFIFWGLAEESRPLFPFCPCFSRSYQIMRESYWICDYFCCRISELFLVISWISPRQRSQTVDNFNSDSAFNFSALLTSSINLSQAYSWFSVRMVYFSISSSLTSCNYAYILVCYCFILVISDFRWEICQFWMFDQCIISRSYSYLIQSCCWRRYYSCQCLLYNCFTVCQNHCMFELFYASRRLSLDFRDEISSLDETKTVYSWSLLVDYSSPSISIVSWSLLP